MNEWLIAAVWMGLALAASLLSIRLAISVALVEIIVGILAGNLIHHYMVVTDWINFLAGFGSVLLTFLAGAEIEPDTMKRYWREALTIGFAGFLVPMLGAMAYTYRVAHWDINAAKIAGIAMSTTSVAVVYAVMVETGLNRVPVGKLILAACFVCDLGTVLALGVMFANYNVWLLLLIIVATGVLMATPRATRWIFGHFGQSVSEPDVKFLFLLLFFLGGLAAQANSEAVLTAYLLGLVVASVLSEHKDTVRHMRSTVFTMLTPFYFLKAGMYVSLKDLWFALGVTATLFLVKMVAKIIGIYPLTYVFKFDRRLANYTTAMMSTGLTFGTISALYGLNHHYINQTQYTVVVTVVIGSAIIPTMIAQRFFRPDVEIPPEIDGDHPAPGPGYAAGVSSVPARAAGAPATPAQVK